MIRYVAFGLVVDDILWADGRQAAGVLGGGGPQAAFGMRLWSEGVGLIAAVGEDWPEAHRAQLAAADIDLRGVRTGPWRTPRAWQVYDGAGRRHHQWQVPPGDDQPDWARSLELAPADYRSARGYHVGVHPESAALDFVRNLQARGGRVSLELFRPAVRPLDDSALRALVSAPDILSLNLAEAQSVCGESQPRAALRCLHQAGARLVALRLGQAGALVSDIQRNQVWRIPALSVPVVDPTGAGNAFSGAFLVGYVETGDLVTAGLWGSVAASFIVETVGVSRLDAGVRREARRRLDLLRPRTEPQL